MESKLRQLTVVAVVVISILLPPTYPQVIVLVAALAVSVLSALLPTPPADPVLSSVPPPDLSEIHHEIAQLKKQVSDLSLAKAFTKR